MARPHKQTVDYFPHDSRASDSTTLTIIESKFGNDGFAFWFKLLERLASTDGHFIDCRNPAMWQFLLAKSHLGEDVAIALLDNLSTLQAIDKELWDNRIIWSQNLVNNIADVYKNRRTLVPQKPSLDGTKPSGAIVSTTNNPDPVSNATDDNAQSKVKESKVKESKVNNIIPDFVDKELWNDFMDMRTRKQNPNTGRSKKLLISRLTEFKNTGYDPNRIIENSIVSGWTGVFEPKSNEVLKNGTHRKNLGKLPSKYTKPDELLQ